MPFKSEHAQLQGTKYDRRVRLSDQQKKWVIISHQIGISIHQIAKAFDVSRRLIQFILFPERHAKSIDDRNKRGGSKQYYETEKNRLAQANTRRYKEKLFKQNLIKMNTVEYKITYHNGKPEFILTAIIVATDEFMAKKHFKASYPKSTFINLIKIK